MWKFRFILIIRICFLVLVPITWYARTGKDKIRLYIQKNSASTSPPLRTSQSPNVLFICVDDLGEDISPLNKLKEKNDPFYQKVYTPNLERLASDSLVLAQAYNQFPYCNPSRSSLLTGRRPDTTHVYDLEMKFRQVGGNFTTIPQYFKESGYHTFGIGKVFHHHLFQIDVDPLSWSEPFSVTVPNGRYHLLGDGPKAVTKKERLQLPIQDDVVLEGALKKMHKFSDSQTQPWFLAVGFGATHTPLVFPAELLQLYPLKNITLPPNLHPPVNAPEVSRLSSGTWAGMTKRSRLPEHRVEPSHLNSTTILLKWRQAYYCAISYLDALEACRRAGATWYESQYHCGVLDRSRLHYGRTRQVGEERSV